MKLAEGAVPRGVHTNVHQGYNANFLCATEDGKLFSYFYYIFVLQ